jgi:hypothetical protein
MHGTSADQALQPLVVTQVCKPPPDPQRFAPAEQAGAQASGAPASGPALGPASGKDAGLSAGASIRSPGSGAPSELAPPLSGSAPPSSGVNEASLGSARG